MTEYVTHDQYDAEMAALKAEIDTLKAIVSTMQRSGLSNRVAILEHHQQPLAAIGKPLYRHPNET